MTALPATPETSPAMAAAMTAIDAMVARQREMEALDALATERTDRALGPYVRFPPHPMADPQGFANTLRHNAIRKAQYARERRALGVEADTYRRKAA